MKRIPKLTKKDLTRFWDKVDVQGPDDCWEWTASTNDGYGQFSIGYIQYRASRVSFAIHYGDPGEINVCHSCDNPPCVNPSHLWLGTLIDNNVDKLEKGRQSCKLTKDEVGEILHHNGTYQSLVRRFGVSKSTIGSIKRGLFWKHIEGPRYTEANSNSQTGVKGISPTKAGRFVVAKMLDGERFYLGTFDTIFQAKKTLDKWEREHVT